MGWPNYNLITFGCSHTYGQGLPDCVDPIMWGPKKTPTSKFAWPNKLKDLVQFNTLDNQSFAGSSNKMIVKSVVEYKNFNKNSVVVILWTNPNRHTIFEDKNNIRYHFMPHNVDYNKIRSHWMSGEDRKLFHEQTINYYSELQTDYDDLFSTMLYINYVNNHLKSKGIRCFNLIAEHHFPNNFEDFLKFNSDSLKLKLFTWTRDFQIDDALDGPPAHPGVKSHYIFARNIRKWFFS